LILLHFLTGQTGLPLAAVSADFCVNKDKPVSSVPAIPPVEVRAAQPAPALHGDDSFSTMLDAATGPTGEDGTEVAQTPAAPMSRGDARSQALERNGIKGAHDIRSSRAERAGASAPAAGFVSPSPKPSGSAAPTLTMPVGEVASAETNVPASGSSGSKDVGKRPVDDTAQAVPASQAESQPSVATTTETEISSNSPESLFIGDIEKFAIISADQDASPETADAPVLEIAGNQLIDPAAKSAQSSNAPLPMHADGKPIAMLAADVATISATSETGVANVQRNVGAIAQSALPTVEATPISQPALGHSAAKGAIEAAPVSKADTESLLSPPVNTPQPTLAKPLVAASSEPPPPAAEPVKPAMSVPEAAAKAPPVVPQEAVRAAAPPPHAPAWHVAHNHGPLALPLKASAIAVEIVSKLHQGTRRFDIRLDPPELGRVDVRLEVDRGGNVATKLTVDRPETLELMQREARGLERALQQAGLKTDAGGLEFSLRQHAEQGAERHRAFHEAAQEKFTGGDEHAAPLIVDGYKTAAYARGGIDIRI
jgi:flagellar hook-length control protein FliK